MRERETKKGRQGDGDIERVIFFTEREREGLTDWLSTTFTFTVSLLSLYGHVKRKRDKEIVTNCP